MPVEDDAMVAVGDVGGGGGLADDDDYRGNSFLRAASAAHRRGI